MLKFHDQGRDPVRWEPECFVRSAPDHQGPHREFASEATDQSSLISACQIPFPEPRTPTSECKRTSRWHQYQSKQTRPCIVYMYVRMYVCAYIHIVYVHCHTHTHTHIHMYIYTHTYTHYVYYTFTFKGTESKSDAAYAHALIIKCGNPSLRSRTTSQCMAQKSERSYRKCGRSCA